MSYNVPTHKHAYPRGYLFATCTSLRLQHDMDDEEKLDITIPAPSTTSSSSSCIYIPLEVVNNAVQAQEQAVIRPVQTGAPYSKVVIDSDAHCRQTQK